MGWDLVITAGKGAMAHTVYEAPGGMPSETAIDIVYTDKTRQTRRANADAEVRYTNWLHEQPWRATEIAHHALWMRNALRDHRDHYVKFDLI